MLAIFITILFLLQILLNTMHKYFFEFVIEENNCKSRRLVFQFHVTRFVTVTAYQSAMVRSTRCMCSVCTVYSACAQYVLHTVHVLSMYCIQCMCSVCTAHSVCAQYVLYTVHVLSMHCTQCMCSVCTVYSACAQYVLHTVYVLSMYCTQCMCSVCTAHSVCAQYVLHTVYVLSMYCMAVRVCWDYSLCISSYYDLYSLLWYHSC